MEALAGFVSRHRRLLVLTGAGCSTDSGIPDYRDADGRWKHLPPVFYQEFVQTESARQRYWARSFLGWPRFAAARPNAAHVALARLEQAGVVRDLVTQNVDGLHQRAGSRRIVDLHGRLDTVTCLGCGARGAREAVQERLKALNPGYRAASVGPAPDGDAVPMAAAIETFRVPPCPTCGGVLKPAVVFFGESVPRQRVAEVMARLAEADALLVVGSSLMVYSGYRFCAAARSAGKPIAALNLGRTRADAEVELKVSAPCAEVLSGLLARLGLTPEPAPPSEAVPGGPRGES